MFGVAWSCLAAVCGAALAGSAPERGGAAWVRARVDAWQPTTAERAFERIGWVGGLEEALDLARRHSRPIFLFTYDGASLPAYRC